VQTEDLPAPHPRADQGGRATTANRAGLSAIRRVRTAWFSALDKVAPARWTLVRPRPHASSPCIGGVPRTQLGQPQPAEGRDQVTVHVVAVAGERGGTRRHAANMPLVRADQALTDRR
jgi:hypothetical protein